LRLIFIFWFVLQVESELFCPFFHIFDFLSSESRNKHGLTPLGCAVGGTQGRWKQFSNATVEDWQKAADTIRLYEGSE